MLLFFSFCFRKIFKYKKNLVLLKILIRILFCIKIVYIYLKIQKKYFLAKNYTSTRTGLLLLSLLALGLLEQSFSQLEASPVALNNNSRFHLLVQRFLLQTPKRLRQPPLLHYPIVLFFQRLELLLQLKQLLLLFVVQCLNFVIFILTSKNVVFILFSIFNSFFVVVNIFTCFLVISSSYLLSMPSTLVSCFHFSLRSCCSCSRCSRTRVWNC